MTATGPAGPRSGPGSRTRSSRSARSRARAAARPRRRRFVRSELEALGLAVEEDATAPETGADCGNLYARVPGPDGARTVMLCAHVDTVPLADRVEVELVDGIFRNRREAILGADNKAAVAVLLEIARGALPTPPPVGVELVFTTCEEIGLRGAQAFEVGRSRPSSATRSTMRPRSAS